MLPGLVRWTASAIISGHSLLHMSPSAPLRGPSVGDKDEPQEELETVVDTPVDPQIPVDHDPVHGKFSLCHMMLPH